MQKKPYLLLIISFLSVFFINNVRAQTVTPAVKTVNTTFKIINDKKEPVSYATVAITLRTDSTNVLHQMADSNGVAHFKLNTGSQYTVKATNVNYLDVVKNITVAGVEQTFILIAEPQPKMLGAVSVRSAKPIMRQEEDKLIVEPENLIPSSTSSYEVLEKTPGLFVDQDGNIYISSMTPATVQINGQEMKMSAADVATMLKSLPPNAISRIEIVRTPSAKYDASGSGGVVNVVLKKGVKPGMTGSVNAGWQQGTYGNKYAGLSLNNNQGKKSSFLNLNYSRRNNFENIVTNRLFAPDSILSQSAHTIYPASTYFAGYGLTRNPGKWSIDLGSSISLNDYNNETKNQGSIIKQSNQAILANNINNVGNDGYALNYRFGINGKKKLDTLGSEWENDVFYNLTKNHANQVYQTNFLIPVIPSSNGDGLSDNHRNMIVARSDLKYKLAGKLTIESGIKASWLWYQSITGYFKGTGSNRVKDIGRTNTFHYDENIYAAYVQGTKTLGKDFVLKTGVRLENTQMSGRQIVPGDTSFNINRTDLFPYIYLSKKLMSIAGFELRSYLVYRRTISRPVYDQLNPFPRYLDPYTSETGNPSLRPQFTENYEFNISVDQTPLLAVGVNDTKDIFTNVIYQADSSRSTAYRTLDNLGSNREWYLRGMGALPPGKKYFLVIGAQYNHNFYQGLYEDKPLSFKKGTWTIFSYQTLKFGKRSLMTINGFVRFRGQQQFYELSTFGSLNASINRQFLKQKLVVTLNVNDIFKTNRNDFTINQGSVNAAGYRNSDSRRFGINLRYNFGIRRKDDSGNPLNPDIPDKNN
jgi:outer membrane receptor protein involved in Fe transport